jgi:hypothetical protein
MRGTLPTFIHDSGAQDLRKSLPSLDRGRVAVFVDSFLPAYPFSESEACKKLS